MDEINLTDDERRALRDLKGKSGRRIFTLIVVTALSSVFCVVGFMAWRAWSRGASGFHVDGDVMFLPAVAVALAVVIFAPQKQGRAANKLELALANKRERWMPRVLLLEAMLTLIVAGLFAWSQNFSVSLIVLPVVILGLLRFRRPCDELGQAIAQRAMVAGFLSAFTTLSALILAAGFAPHWLVRLAPMALAIPMAVAAAAFALESWRADRDA